jgi:hypothetical protein
MAIKTFTKEYYVASDGTEFEDIQQAKEYEEYIESLGSVILLDNTCQLLSTAQSELVKSIEDAYFVYAPTAEARRAVKEEFCGYGNPFEETHTNMVFWDWEKDEWRDIERVIEEYKDKIEYLQKAKRTIKTCAAARA